MNIATIDGRDDKLSPSSPTNNFTSDWNIGLKGYIMTKLRSFAGVISVVGMRYCITDVVKRSNKKVPMLADRKSKALLNRDMIIHWHV